MELKVLECSQYMLDEKIREFRVDHNIKNITYLFKAPANIISIIEFTTTKKYKDRIAKEEREEKLTKQKAEVKYYLR